MMQSFIISAIGCITLPFVIPLAHSFISNRKCSHSADIRSLKQLGPIRNVLLGLDFVFHALFGTKQERYLEAGFSSFQKLGSTYTVSRWMWNTVFTCDSRNIKHLLATGFHDFELPQTRVSALESLFGSGIFSLNGHSWSQARNMLKPCFSKRNTSVVTDLLEQNFQALLREIMKDDGKIDLQPLFFCLAMDFATGFLTGNSANMLDCSTGHGRNQQFVEDYTICSEEAMVRMSLGPLRYLRINRAAFRAQERIIKYTEDFIEATLALELEGLPAEQCSLLSELAKVAKDRRNLRDHMLHILVAARDTTASVLSNLFFVLAKDPVTYARLRAEILAHCGDTAPTAQQVKGIEYLRFCVQESLRLHPVIPTNARQASKNTTLPYGGGNDGNSPLAIKKGSTVIYDVYSMHRDAAVFGANPEEFRPERWSNLRPGWGYLPFNGGPRICMGQQVALLEIQYIVARLVQNFEKIESQDGRDWEEIIALATTCKNGVNVHMIPNL